MTEEELKLFSEFLEQRNYSKEEKLHLAKLRYEDPEKYLEEVRTYRRDKRDQGTTAKGFVLGATTLGAAGATTRVVRGLNEKPGFFGRRKEELELAPRAAITGTLAGAALGALGGGIVSGIQKIKHSPKKDSIDKLNVLKEKHLQKENPEEYKKLKSEQKDTISVMEGKMTKKEFKEKHGHKPKLKF